VAAIVVGWGLALAADLSGRAEELHHDALVEGGLPLWASLTLFLVAWQAMIAAMMLPSSLPLIRLFAIASRRQPRAGIALLAFLGGYALVWTFFGTLAFLGDVGVHSATEALPWLHERPWLVAGGVLALAGAFEFSKLKDACLSKCRHPGPYLLGHYRRGASGAFHLGLGHGLFCLGCCWALMLVLFAAGIAVLWWMAALTALMVYEKVGRHGEQVKPVAGATLLGLAGLVFLFGASTSSPADAVLGSRQLAGVSSAAIPRSCPAPSWTAAMSSSATAPLSSSSTRLIRARSASSSAYWIRSRT
jgi:predicted metal-binding membrane protein